MSMLTNEQSQFLDAEGKIVLCACPGSGKTFVVGKKVVKYLENWAYDYRGMAVLSFTNVASEEIIKQVNELNFTNNSQQKNHNFIMILFLILLSFPYFY